MDVPSVPVLYIAGSGRSGSTLLASVLGSVDGVFNAGELRYVWERGLADGALCACRKPVIECPVWTDVFKETNGGIERGQGLLRHMGLEPCARLVAKCLLFGAVVQVHCKCPGPSGATRTGPHGDVEASAARWPTRCWLHIGRFASKPFT